MTTIHRHIVWVCLLWYVVTYDGRPVAGPFTFLEDCASVAKTMIDQGYRVNPFCQFRSR